MQIFVDSSPVRVQNTKDIKRWASVVSDIDAVQTADDLGTEQTTETTAAITQSPPTSPEKEPIAAAEAPPSSPTPVSAAPTETSAAAITTNTTSTGISIATKKG